MNEEMQKLITKMKDPEVLKLAVDVQRDLEDNASDDVFARLSPTAADEFLQSLAELQNGLLATSDIVAMANVARLFLDKLLRAEVFDEIIVNNVINAGVRLSVKDIANWFKGNFNLGNLLKIQFEYEDKVITRTPSITTEKTRSIRLSTG